MTLENDVIEELWFGSIPLSSLYLTSGCPPPVLHILIPSFSHLVTISLLYVSISLSKGKENWIIWFLDLNQQMTRAL